MTLHRWVPHAHVRDYLLLGWMALPTLEGTNHGLYAAHCVWLCACPVASPASAGDDRVGRSAYPESAR